jgi:hypothetical protein
LQACNPGGLVGQYNKNLGVYVPNRPYNKGNVSDNVIGGYRYDGDGSQYGSGTQIKTVGPDNAAAGNFTVLDYNDLGIFPPCLMGSSKSISDIFSGCSMEQIFTRISIPQIYLGKPVLKSVTKRRVIIPVPDFILGFLVDPTKFKLVPINAFKQPISEIRFTKDAFVSSWWTQNLDCRKYTIEDVQLKFEWMMIYDRNIMIAQESLIAVGITLSFTGYYSCLQQNIVGGAMPTNF